MIDSKVTRRGMLGGVAATAGIVAVTVDVAGAQPRDLDDSALMEYFKQLSADATGFPRADLEEAGQAEAYFQTVRDGVGSEMFEELLQAYHDNGLAEVLSSPKSGPIARNIIKLWYAATWERLPDAWREAYGVPPNDNTFVVSADAYTTGLLWSAIGVNPPGANAPGFGTWSDPPERL